MQRQEQNPEVPRFATLARPAVATPEGKVALSAGPNDELSDSRERRLAGRVPQRKALIGVGMAV